MSGLAKEPMRDRFARLTTGQMLWVIVKLLCWGLEREQKGRTWKIVDEAVAEFESPGEEAPSHLSKYAGDQR